MNVVKTRSEKVDREKVDEVKFDNNFIEVKFEVRENMNKQKEVISPINPVEEKTKPAIKFLYPS